MQVSKSSLVTQFFLLCARTPTSALLDSYFCYVNNSFMKPNNSAAIKGRLTITSRQMLMFGDCKSWLPEKNLKERSTNKTQPIHSVELSLLRKNGVSVGNCFNFNCVQQILNRFSFAMLWCQMSFNPLQNEIDSFFFREGCTVWFYPCLQSFQQSHSSYRLIGVVSLAITACLLL